MDPQWQRFQPAQHQEAILGTDLLAKDALGLAQDAVLAVVIHADASHEHVGVTAQELGGGLDAEIHAQIQASQPQRAGPGVVQHGQYTALACHGRDGRDVLHFHGDRAGRFHADHTSGGLDQFGDVRTDVRPVEFHLHAHVRQPFLGKGLERTIAGRRDQQMVATAHEAHDGGHQGGRTGGRNDAVAGVFQRGDTLLQQARRGGAGDAIAEAIGLALLALDKVLEGVEYHGGGAHHRGRETGERGLR